jgi:hypothetical protein
MNAGLAETEEEAGKIGCDNEGVSVSVLHRVIYQRSNQFQTMTDDFVDVRARVGDHRKTFHDYRSIAGYF